MKDVDYTIPQEEIAEFIGEIIDIFDDFLDDKQIVLPNKERDEADVDDCCNANIFGSDYDAIADKLETCLRIGGFANEKNFDHSRDQEVRNHRERDHGR